MEWPFPLLYVYKVAVLIFKAFISLCTRLADWVTVTKGESSEEDNTDKSCWWIRPDPFNSSGSKDTHGFRGTHVPSIIPFPFFRENRFFFGLFPPYCQLILSTTRRRGATKTKHFLCRQGWKQNGRGNNSCAGFVVATEVVSPLTNSFFSFVKETTEKFVEEKEN